MNLKGSCEWWWAILPWWAVPAASHAAVLHSRIYDVQTSFTSLYMLNLRIPNTFCPIVSNSIQLAMNFIQQCLRHFVRSIIVLVPENGIQHFVALIFNNRSGSDQLPANHSIYFKFAVRILGPMLSDVVRVLHVFKFFYDDQPLLLSSGT